MADTRLIHASLFTPGIAGKWGQPLILIGDPGSGKTSLLVRIAKEAGMHVEVLIASLRDPTDFLGLMVAGGNVNTIRDAKDIEGTLALDGVTYIPPSWAVRAAKAVRSVVILDEINSAPPAVQAALNRVVLERWVGDFELPDTVRFIAARNELDDASGGYELSNALDNRFGHVKWTGPTFDEWRTYELSGRTKHEIEVRYSAEEEEKRVLAAWDSEVASAAGLITSFLARHQSLWQTKPAPGARGTMRTWDMAINALAGAKVHGLNEDETDAYLSAFVGQPAIVELRAWLAAMDLPDPAELLDGNVKFTPDPDRIDRTMVVLASCAALVAPEGAVKRAERANACWALLKANLANVDVCYPAAMVLSGPKARLVRGYKDADAVLARFHPVLAAAGRI